MTVPEITLASSCGLFDPGTGMSSTSEVDSDTVQDTTDSIVDHSSHEENEEFSLSPVPTPQRKKPPTPAPRRYMHDRKPPSWMKNSVYQFDVKSTPNMQIDKVQFLKKVLDLF